MDVNNVRQSAINTNLNVSQYSATNTDSAIPQVQKIETQSEGLNSDKKEYNQKDMEDALKKINNFLKDEHTHAEYSYHKELKTMMVKVIDEDTKEVLLEIPPKKILDMVASMMKQVGLLDKKA
ncbi:MAG: flagellar protein FlaG [Clostridium beijerinckii]